MIILPSRPAGASGSVPSNVLEFPGNNARITQPDYAGHLLALNPEKGSRFQCYRFLLGMHVPSAVVPPEADMASIHLAIRDGRLVDITSSGEIKTDSLHMAQVQETDTDRKIYLHTDEDGVMTLFHSDDRKVQAELDSRIHGGKLELPPGYDNPEKYLIDLTGIQPKVKTPDPEKKSSWLLRFWEQLRTVANFLI